jgi:hypothetical protein
MPALIGEPSGIRLALCEDCREIFRNINIEKKRSTLREMIVKHVLIFSLLLVSATALATETKLVAVGDISVREGTVSTSITNYILVKENLPSAKVGCSLRHSSVPYTRVIKAGSKFAIKNIGSVNAIDLETAELPVVKEEFERQFAVKVPNSIDTRAKLESFLLLRYGVRVIKGSRYRLAIDVLSEKTNNSYVIECGSIGNSFSADLALEAIRVSNILVYDPEM